jgi:hypothetical protein
MAWDVRIFCGHMEHRRQAIDVVGLIVQLAGFIVLLSLFFPTIRRGLAEFGLLAVCLSVFVCMSLIGFTVYRLIARQSKATTENPFARPGEVSDQTGNSNGTGNESEAATLNNAESETAPDLLEPATRRRYPWRHELADPL